MEEGSLIEDFWNGTPKVIKIDNREKLIERKMLELQVDLRRKLGLITEGEYRLNLDEICEKYKDIDNSCDKIKYVLEWEE